MQQALIGLLGVALGLGGSTWTTVWTNRQNRKHLAEQRLTAREEEATREIRKALISIHHMKARLSEHRQSGGPDELYQLIHVIDTYQLVLASPELRSRLKGSTEIMWMWHVLRSTDGHPVWHALDDATACIGAYLRGEKLPEEPREVRQLCDEAAAIEMDVMLAQQATE